MMRSKKTWSNVVFQVSVIIALVTILRAFELTSDRESIRRTGVEKVLFATAQNQLSSCKPVPAVLLFVKNLVCEYIDILYKSDNFYELGHKKVFVGEHEYHLDDSDHVDIRCKGDSNMSVFGTSWRGHGAAFRPLTPKKPPRGREKKHNVLIFGFDSASKNLFIRKMPKTYKFLQEELNPVILDGYNIVGDGTAAALFPLLTGKTELELPECRKSIKGSGYLDYRHFIFYKLKEDGYRTTYFEDSPLTGTFQYRHNGFSHQPADHYLRAFYLEAEYNKSKRTNFFCLGATPRYKFMMNLTDQFFQLDGKKFGFTFVGDLAHDDPNYLGSADDDLVALLRGLLLRGVFRDTLFMLMGDHGNRIFETIRSTLQGKLEERLPLMAIRLPDYLVSHRPDALDALKLNADVLTTPHDIYATILDALDMRQHYNPHKIKGADFPRGLSLLQRISKNRTCSEAGVEKHWCVCLKWVPLESTDTMYKRTADALVNYINSLTAFVSHLCARRKLTYISWVMRKKPYDRVLAFSHSKDRDRYFGYFNSKAHGNSKKTAYQIKIEVGPGKGVYEASVTHHHKPNTLIISSREISRTNPYNNEPACVSATYPHLNPYCYCIV